MTLDQMIKGCQRNDATAQQALYRTYYALFMKMCYRYALDEDEANAMLHDGFLKIFRNIRKYSGKGSFEGWMKRTLVHCCIDYVRSMRKHHEAVDINEIAEQHFINNAHAGYDKNILDDLSIKEILKLINQLPELTKIVFNLYVFDGYSHKEISLLTGVKEGTSHWHLSRARSILQTKLAMINKLPVSGYEQK